jgi:hypothetical protein
VVWEMGWRFEVSAHHDLEVCKRRLVDLRWPKENPRGSRFDLNVVRVNLSSDGEAIAFSLRKRISGSTWVESKGTLRKGPDRTVMVSGEACVPWLPAIMLVFGIITGIVVAVTIHPIVAIVIPGVWSAVAAMVLFASVRDRDLLEALIFDTLADEDAERTKQ